MRLKTITSFVLLSFVFVTPLQAFKKLRSVAINEDKPVLYYADSQTYDRELGILILKGNVEFEHEGTVLEADYVTYNEIADIITASGHVRMRQPSGDISFAEYVELTGDMKEGVILQLRALLEDDSKLVALEGRKYEDREELDQAVYTPCQLCEDKPPTWQLNARRAVKDEENNDIHFTDTQLRILDTPILYFPYATQPLERRSGFLIPQPRFSSDLGFAAELPYYFAISEDKDLTLIPTYLTKQNGLLQGVYRQVFGNGFVTIEGSITKYKKSQKDILAEKQKLYTIPTTRGHVYGKSVFSLSDVWRLKGEGGFVSDKTYFRKYKFSGWQTEPALTSIGTLEGFLNQRDYLSANVIYFQGLRDADQQRKISSALPVINYDGYSGVDPWGGRFNFNGNFLNLYRTDGLRMQREIGYVGWRRPWIIPSGQVFTIFGSGRGDLYQIENAPSLLTRKKGGEARFFPQSGLEWRWPFVTCWNQQSLIFQPLFQLIGAPRKAIGANARLIPNEDSAGFEFNDANLFSPDRFPGYDLLDTGSRSVYGGQFLTTGTLLGDVELFLGQNYSFSAPNTKDKLEGLRNGFSDYVARIEASPFSWLTLNYRSRHDQKSFDPLVSEVGGSIGPEIASLSGTYVFISKKAFISKKEFNQINLTFTSKFTKYLTFQVNAVQNLNTKKVPGVPGDGALSRGVSLFYRDDCFTLGVTLQRNYFVSRDLKPNDTLFLVTIGFKNVGEYQMLNYSLNKGLFDGQSNQKNTSIP